MKRAWSILTGLWFTAAAIASEGGAGSGLDNAIRGLDCEDQAIVLRSTAALREAGPEGLRAVLERYDRSPSARLEPVIDAVAGQHDALSSRLFWYTDLEQAKAAATQQHKPILYLRLLGNLTDEYSCANSRYFRTVLYANQSVQRLLRDRFVLVWVSERPVPVVTIDYGDGRVMKQTITGNSVHYVLDERGDVVDALPGLFDAATFSTILSSAANGAVADSPDVPRSRATQERDTLLRSWQLDSGNAILSGAPGGVASNRQGAPNAAEAGVRAVSKLGGERPLLAALSPELRNELGRAMDQAGAPAWERAAAAHLDEARLDSGSLALMRRQAGGTDLAAFQRVVDQFQRLIAADTVRNNYQFRRQALEWIGQSRGPLAVEDLNRRVYTELFLTPRSDPWLGLRTADGYLALSTDGCPSKPGQSRD